MTGNHQKMPEVTTYKFCCNCCRSLQKTGLPVIKTAVRSRLPLMLNCPSLSIATDAQLTLAIERVCEPSADVLESDC